MGEPMDIDVEYGPGYEAIHNQVEEPPIAAHRVHPHARDCEELNHPDEDIPTAVTSGSHHPADPVQGLGLPDTVQLQRNIALARDEVRKANRRLKYAEKRLKGVDRDVEARKAKVSTGNGNTRTRVTLGPVKERALRQERVDRAKLDCARYDCELVYALEELRFQTLVSAAN
ncbi:hypothetical protein D9611_013501 [Ephemerocybe angulata]|nr:hypothetical protein D9611_013501 [Tulosesus angulatus]